MSRYTKLGKNIALITIGNFASKLLSFFLIPLYTAVLTTGEFGVADLMTTTINLISPFFTLLISESIMRFALDKEIKKSEVLGIGLSVSLCGFVVMLLFSPLLLLSNDLRPFYPLFIAYYFAATLHSIVSQFVKGIEKVGVYSLAGVAQTICFISLNLILLLGVKIGVHGYLISLIAAHFFATIILWFGARIGKYLPPSLSLNRSLLKQMLRYSIPLIPNALSWWISNSADKYVLTFLCGISVTGVYSVSQRIPSMFSIVSTIFLSAWQISAIEDFGSEHSRKFFSEIYRSYSALNILIVSGIICFTRVIAGVIFSCDFYAGWVYVPILVYAYLFFAMAGFLGTIYTTAKKTRMVFTSTVISALTNIALNFLLIPQMAGVGAAIATFASYFLVWIIRLVDSRRIIKLDIDIRRDTVGYLLVAVQVILMLTNTLYGFILSLCILLVILLLYQNTIRSILKSFVLAIKKREKTEQPTDSE